MYFKKKKKKREGGRGEGDHDSGFFSSVGCQEGRTTDVSCRQKGRVHSARLLLKEKHRQRQSFLIIF